jgi:rubredoxin
MDLETLELRDHRYRAQKALALLKGDDQADERKALEEQIAHFQEICPHEHAEEVEGEWRCRDCDLQKTTAVPEPEPEPAAEAAAAEAKPETPKEPDA